MSLPIVCIDRLATLHRPAFSASRCVASKVVVVAGRAIRSRIPASGWRADPSGPSFAIATAIETPPAVSALAIGNGLIIFLLNGIAVVVKLATPV